MLIFLCSLWRARCEDEFNCGQYIAGLLDSRSCCNIVDLSFLYVCTVKCAEIEFYVCYVWCARDYHCR